MKRFYKFLMPLVAIVAMALPMQAQDVSMYTLATDVDATKWVTLSASATEVTSIYDDDEASSVMNIGFTFTFAGASYTQWSCNSNGRIALGSTAVDEWWTNPFTPDYITDTRTVFPLIAALGMDNTMAGSGVWCKYEVVGEAPSRMLVIEYRTPSEYDEEGDLVNYQIQLEEGTNVVRFVYGATSATLYDDFQAGMASSVDDVITVSPSHNALTGPTDTVHSSWPGVNRYYEFIPPTSFCGRVASVSIDTVGTDFITLSWVDNNNSSWYVRIDSTDVPGDLELVSDTFYTFNYLSPNTLYTVSVAALCDNGDTSAWRSLTGRTLAGDPVSEFPYSCGFEITEDGVNQATDWVLENGTQANAWYVGTATQNGGSRSMYVSSDNGSTNSYNTGSTSYVFAYATFSFEAGEYAYSYDWYANGESCCDFIRAAVVPNSVEFTAGSYCGFSSSADVPAGGIAIDGGGKLNQQSSWQNRTGTFNIATAGLYKVVFMWRNDGSVGTNPPAAIDNIAISRNTCPAPSNFTVNVQGDTVDFAWTDDLGTDWDLAYVAPGMTPTEDNIIPLTSTSYQATEVAMGFYDAYVRTNCGSDDVSLWVGPVNFSVGITNMNMATSGTDTLRTCLATIYDDGGATGAYSTNCNSTLVVYPNQEGSMLQVSGLSYTEGTWDYLRIYDGVGTNGEVLFDDYGVTATQTFGPFFIDGPITIAFHSDGSVTYSGFEINVACVAAPDCQRPESFNLLSLLADSAEFSWTDNTNTSWGIEYGPAGFVRGNTADTNIHWALFSDTTGWIENLVPGTNYDFYLVALCTDTSFARQITAQTPCTAIPDTSMPYHYGFEEPSVNVCWRTFNVGNSTTYPYTSTSYAAEGTRSLYFYGYSSNYYSYAVMPMFEAPINTLMLDFKLYKTSSSYGSIEVGVMTNPSDINTFQSIGIYQPTNLNTWESFRVNLGNFSGTGRFIAFLQRSTYSTYLDDVTVSVRPACPNPVNVNLVSASSSSAYVAWDYASGYETVPDGYRLTLTDAAGTPTVVNNVTTTNYVFTGLTPGSEYTLTVETECEGAYSEAASLAFSTLNLPCIAYDSTSSDTIQIGNGTSTSYYLPIGNYYNYSYTQQLFTPDELGGAKTITGIDFEYAYSSSMTSKTNVTIYMATVSATSLASGFVPYNAATFVPVYTGSLNCSTGWNHFDFTTPFVYDGTGNLLVVVHDNSGGYNGSSYTFRTHSTANGMGRYVQNDGSAYNISSVSGGTSVAYRVNTKFTTYGCSQTSTCAAPLVATSNVQPTSVDLMWAPGNTESAWTVEHKAVGDANWTVDLTNTSATTYSYTGLQASTEYMFRVSHTCGTDNYATVISVTTPCLPAAVPFSENFGTWTASSTAPTPSCWYRNSNYSTSSFYPYVSSSYSMSAGRSMYMYSSSSSYSYLVLPKMDAPIDTLNLSFYLLKSNTSYSHAVNVGVMTNPEDVSTFQQIGTATPSQLMEWEGFEFSFRGTNVPDGYIAIMSPNGVYSYPYLDNIEVNYYNPCERPTNVRDSANTVSSAVVYWTDTVTTDFVVEYGPHGFALGTGTQLTATTNSVAITGLNHSSYYDVYVRGNCSGTNSLWSFVHTFATECAPIDALPYVENFNNWGTGSHIHAPYCWSYGSDYSSSYPYIISSYNASGSTGGSMYMYNYDYNHVGYLTWFALPMLDSTVASINQTEVVFSTIASTTSYVHNVMVGVNTTPSVTGATWIDTVTALYDEWTEYEVPFDSYTGNGKYVVFATYVDTNYSNSYPYIDDLTLEMIPSCRRPDSLTVANATTTTVDLGWYDRSSATGWVIEYGPRGFQLGTGTTVTATSNPFTLTGLPVAFQGEYYVKAICAVGDTSDYSRRSCPFETTQIPATLPYNYDFENVAEWNNWQTSTNHETNGWYRGTSVADSGSYSMYVATADSASYYGYNFDAVVNAAVYRDIDFGPVDSSYTLTFRARAGGTTTASYDGLMVFLVDPSVATVASTANITTPWGNVNDLYRIASVRLDTTWQTYEASFDTISGVHRVAFFWFNQNTGASYANIPQPAAVDNIHIKYSTCPRPVNLQAVAGTTSANLTWQGPANATYEITYRRQGDTVNQVVTSNTNSYVLSGLTSPATYLAWVRKLCGAGDTSLYSDGVRFNTNCATITSFPWTETFEDDASLLCWQQEGDGLWELGEGDYSTSTGAHGGSQNALITHTDRGDVTMLISPILSLSGSATLSFWHVQRVWAGDQDELRVYYRTSQTDTWHELASYTSDISSWTLDSIELPVTSPTFQIAFEMTDDYGYGVAIDDITVNGIGGGLCEAPVILSDTTSETTATFTWDATTASEYEVAIVEGTWTEPANGTSVAALTYTFNGLTANTTYTLGVRSVCGIENYSEWTTVTVTTDEHPCATPSALTVSDVTLTSATLGWTIGEAETQWELHVTGTNYDETITVTTNPYTLTGLTPAVTYSFTVSAVCSETQTSDPSEAQAFTTASCQPVSGVVVSNVTTNSAQVSWTAVQGVNGYEVEYGASGFNQGAGTTVQASTNSATLTGLTANMAYDVYVRSVCGEGIYSAWSSANTFTTDEQGEGIDDVNSAAIALYPNPATTTVTISGIEGQAMVTIVDMNGRVSGEWRVENGEITLDLTGYAQGAYFVRITGEQQNAIRKLIVK